MRSEADPRPRFGLLTGWYAATARASVRPLTRARDFHLPLDRAGDRCRRVSRTGGTGGRRVRAGRAAGGRGRRRRLRAGRTVSAAREGDDEEQGDESERAGPRHRRVLSCGQRWSALSLGSDFAAEVDSATRLVSTLAAKRSVRWLTAGRVAELRRVGSCPTKSYAGLWPSLFADDRR